MNSAKKIPSPLVSLFPIAFLVGMLFATIHTFGSDALSGGSQISLLATTGMCVFIGMAFYRIPWKDYELAITNNISGVATAIIILLIIGALSGTWMISGVVPTLIYYGMQIIHPNFFLASTCIICALVSVMTGSSWTTIATIGIALLGIGKAQGFEEGWIAGADYVGLDEYVEKIKGGWTDVDVIITTPNVMGKVGALGRILGPRGLMPNPKTGTVTMDVAKAVSEVKAGKIDFKVDKFGIVHTSIGKVSFSPEQIVDNANEFLSMIMKLKPSAAKGSYVKSIYLSSTMSPGLQIDAKSVETK